MTKDSNLTFHAMKNRKSAFGPLCAASGGECIAQEIRKREGERESRCMNKLIVQQQQPQRGCMQHVCPLLMLKDH